MTTIQEGLGWICNHGSLTWKILLGLQLIIWQTQLRGQISQLYNSVQNNPFNYTYDKKYD